MAFKQMTDKEILRIYHLGKNQKVPTLVIAKRTGRSIAIIRDIVVGRRHSDLTGAKNEA